MSSRETSRASTSGLSRGQSRDVSRDRSSLNESKFALGSLLDASVAGASATKQSDDFTLSNAFGTRDLLTARSDWPMFD